MSGPSTQPAQKVQAPTTAPAPATAPAVTLPPRPDTELANMLRSNPEAYRDFKALNREYSESIQKDTAFDRKKFDQFAEKHKLSPDQVDALERYQEKMEATRSAKPEKKPQPAAAPEPKPEPVHAPAIGAAPGAAVRASGPRAVYEQAEANVQALEKKYPGIGQAAETELGIAADRLKTMESTGSQTKAFDQARSTGKHCKLMYDEILKDPRLSAEDRAAVTAARKQASELETDQNGKKWGRIGGKAAKAGGALGGFGFGL